jgi:hypothetical protein
MDNNHAPPDSAAQNFSYKGHKVELLEAAHPHMPMLVIDGVKIMIQREETGGYSAPMLNMHATYPTLEAMAKQLIEISPVLLAKQKQNKEQNKK